VGENMMLGILDFVGNMLYSMLSWFTDNLITPLVKTAISAVFKSLCYYLATFGYLISVFLL